GITSVAVSQAVEGFGVEGQGWDEMLRGVHWAGAAEVASVVVGALIARPPHGAVLVNLNVPNMEVKEMSGWQHTTMGRIPARGLSKVALEPRLGHPGTYKVVMTWGDAVSLPAGTDGGAVERDLVSVTLLGHLTDADSPTTGPAEAEARAVIGA